MREPPLAPARVGLSIRSRLIDLKPSPVNDSICSSCPRGKGKERDFYHTNVIKGTPRPKEMRRIYFPVHNPSSLAVSGCYPCGEHRTYSPRAPGAGSKGHCKKRGQPWTSATDRAVSSWAGHLASLSLGFLLYKTDATKPPQDFLVVWWLKLCIPTQEMQV